jgi:hypothetical protein
MKHSCREVDVKKDCRWFSLRNLLYKMGGDLFLSCSLSFTSLLC